MATPSQEETPLNDGEPNNFDARFESWIEMQYIILPRSDPSEEEKYQFDYRRVDVRAKDKSLLPEKRTKGGWITFWRDGELVQPLDIHIKHGDTIVYIETVDIQEGRHLYWSIENDAITTMGNKQEIYGELRYNEPDGFKRRSEVSETEHRLIRFKADMLPKPPKSHKFNYYVRLTNGDGKLVEHKIDPEIKNPSS